MAQKDQIQLFEDKRIRSAWDPEKEEWYFSIVDVCEVLSGTDNPRRYWSDLKRKLKSEGAVELYEKIVQLKMTAPDGKKRLTDVANTEQLLRIIQSIPSPKAEPFKLWLAQIGRERIEETIDPELTIDRALETYLRKGYSHEWINQRLQAIQVRKELTDEWDARGVQKGVEYAILTDEITKAWSGMNTRQYKNLKGLKKENLRDNMTTLELVLNMLAEATTTEISKQKAPEGFYLDENAYYFEITENGKTVTVENEAGKGFVNTAKVGSLKIIKTSSDGKVEGFTFRVTGANGYDRTFTTNKNGEIIIEGLRIGDYTISEVQDSVSASYVLPADKIATVKVGSTTVVEMHNELRDTPKTGDNSNVGLWTALAGLSALGIVGTAVVAYRKKKKEDNE